MHAYHSLEDIKSPTINFAHDINTSTCFTAYAYKIPSARLRTHYN